MAGSGGEMAFMASLIALSSVIFSSLCYLAEQNQSSEQFKSIPDAIWWSCITQVIYHERQTLFPYSQTTVGYGDVVPVTAVGKVIAIACALTGILAIALPVPAIINRFQEEQENVAGQKQLANLPENERFLTKLFLTPMKHKL